MTAKRISMTQGLARLPFRVPIGAEIKVQPDEKVEKGTVLAIRSGTEAVYDLAGGLGLKQGKGAYRLKKGAGDAVKMGDTLAEREDG